MSALLRLIGILLLCNLVGCSRQNAAQQHNPLPVQVMAVQSHHVPVNYSYIGKTQGSREIEIRSRVTGQVEKRLYEEGAVVSAGQPLFQIDPKPFQLNVANARATVAKSEARLEQAQRDVIRLTPLAEADAVNRKDLDDAKTVAQMAQADLQQTQAQLGQAELSLQYSVIRAPVTGMVSKMLLQEGSLVNANGSELLATQSQLDPVRVVFHVPDTDYQSRLRAVSQGLLQMPESGYTVHLALADGTRFSTPGTIRYIAPKVNPDTGTLEMHAYFANSHYRLKSGVLVNVLLEGAQIPNAITVPQRAVLDTPQGKIVLVAEKTPGGQVVAKKRPVEVGIWVEGAEKTWVINKGLAVGDLVILDNLTKLGMMPEVPVIPNPAAAH